MEVPGFWDDPDKSSEVMKRVSALKGEIESYESLEQQYDDIMTLIEMAAEENDETLLEEIKTEMDDFITKFDNMRIRFFGHHGTICEETFFDDSA